MKKLMFATALVASAVAFADEPTALNAISFEGYTAGATFNTVATEKDEGGNNKSDGPYFLYLGEQDGSSVKAYGGDNLVAPSITRPSYFAQTLGNSNANYLDLSTEGGVLWRSINALRPDGDTNILGLAQSIPENGSIYLDTLVQFTPTEDGGTPELGDEDKLAIWLNVSEGATNLMVRAAVVDDSGTPTPTTFTITNKTANAGTWYRLTIKAIADISDGTHIPAFQIMLDGQVQPSWRIRNSHRPGRRLQGLGRSRRHRLDHGRSVRGRGNRLHAHVACGLYSCVLRDW